MTPSLFEQLKIAGKLPSARGVALKVSRLCQSETVPLAELARIIQGDPALAGKIIKLANANNPRKFRPIGSINIDTLLLVGVHSIRQVVFGFALVGAFRKGESRQFDFDRYWSLSVAMGSVAQTVASLTPLAPAGELFICGLLSRVGTLCLATGCPTEYDALLLECAQSGTPLLEAEQRAFGSDHRALGQALLADWGIPKLFHDPIYDHEQALSQRFEAGSRADKLATTFHLAWCLAQYFVGSETPSAMDAQHIQACVDKLELGAEQCAPLVERSLQEWQTWGKLLEVNTHTPPPLFAADAP